jgi:hypothetical protein
MGSASRLVLLSPAGTAGLGSVIGTGEQIRNASSLKILSEASASGTREHRHSDCRHCYCRQNIGQVRSTRPRVYYRTILAFQNGIASDTISIELPIATTYYKRYYHCGINKMLK